MHLSKKLLSTSRLLAFLAILGVSIAGPDISRGSLALYVVSAAFLTATTAVIVEWLPSTPKLKSAALWAEIGLLTILCWHTVGAYQNDSIVSLYMPVMATIPGTMERRQWAPCFAALLGSLLLAFTAALPSTDLNILLMVMVAYGAALLFFGSVGVLMRNLQDQKARSEALLREVTESRAALERAHRQLQDSAARQQEMAVLEERQRLAREIHDSVAHGLTALVVQLQAARRLADRDPALSVATVARCEEMAREALQETRRAVRALHPSGLEQQADVAALERLARDYAAATGMHVTVTADEQARALAPDAGRLEQLYRIFQEALTNAHRHGEAQSVSAELTMTGTTLHLQIQNDGKPPETLDPGVGLKSMMERSRSLGGTIAYEPEPDGMTIRVSVPVKQEATL